MDITQLEKNITELVNHHLTGWAWKWDRATRRYGCCHQSQKLITISKPIASINPWEETKDTVLHEIAHAIVGAGHGHDKVWKNACRLIGARPIRCYSTSRVATPIPKYFAVCSHCGKISYRNTMPRKRKYSCGRCSPYFNSEYILTFKPNPCASYNPQELI